LKLTIENKSYNESYSTSDYSAIYDIPKRTVNRSGVINHSKYGSVKLEHGILKGEGSSLSSNINGTVQTESNQSEPEYKLSLDANGDNKADFFAFVPESKLLGVIENTHSAPDVIMISPPEFLINEKTTPDFVVKDKEYDFLSFKWSIDPVDSAQVSNADSLLPKFLVSKEGAYKLKVMVSDQTQAVEKTFPVFFTSAVSNEMKLPDIIAGEKLTYQLQITQNSLDPYVFTIESAPPGTTISETGLITWLSDPAQQEGTESISVRATNSLHSYSFWGEFHVSAPTDSRQITLISSNIPAEIMPGDDVKFSLAASGIAGGVTYELLSGPSGLSLDQSGSISWKAPQNDGYLPYVEYPLDIYVSSGNRFARYTVPLSVHHSERSISALAQGLTLVPMLSYSVADVDHNGKNELLITEDTNLVQAFSWNAHENKYAQSWFLPYSFGENYALRKTCAQTIKLVDGTSGLAVTLGNTLYMLAADLHTVLQTTNLHSSSEIERMLAADLDKDGVQDILLVQRDWHITALNQSMGVIWEATKSGDSRYHVVIANMDTDSELELAIGNIGIFSAKSGVQKWVPSGGLGPVIGAVDIDGDGVKEIADSVEPGKIRI
ncbi:MAG TPA: hypothetical protein VFM18_07105, partial [Methanosarcina sp.]|nr:hypothetical protein [Methanosarcina sp.]